MPLSRPDFPCLRSSRWSVRYARSAGRTFFRAASASLLGVSLAAVSGFAQVSEKSTRPNVLFIAIDDLNDWIGPMKGHPQAHTPNLDRLASRGVLFNNAHCAAPVCLASRTAIFAGRYPEATGVYSNWGATQGKAPPRDIQLPVRLAAAGYETLGAGKLYHSDRAAYFADYFSTEQRWSPFTPAQAAYTAEELPSKGTTSPRHVAKGGPGGRDWVLPINGLPSERNASRPEGESFDWGPVEVADEEMGDTRITDWAIKKLGEARPRPFFLGVGYYRPHIPLFAPKRDFDALPPLEAIQLPRVAADDLADLGEQGRRMALDPITAGTHEIVVKNHQWKQAVRAYLACITYVDRQIGRLLDELDRSPYAESTWIILWSDHGWQLGDKEHWGKWTGWRQSTRAPLIIVPPRRQTVAAGQTCEQPVSLVDLYPTVAELCGLPAETGVEGVSLLPLVKTPGKATDRAVVTTVDPGNHALSTAGWRYLRYTSGEEELYDIGQDPREERNLARDPAYDARKMEMRARLERELKGRVVLPVAPAAAAVPSRKSAKARESTRAAKAGDSLLGRWALALSDGRAGWLGVEQRSDGLQVSLLWGSGSVVTTTVVAQESSTLKLSRQVNDTTRQSLNVSLKNGELVIESTFLNRAGKVTASASAKGRRLPALPPRPDLSKVRWGQPQSLLAGDLASRWLPVTPTAPNGWSLHEGVLSNRVDKGLKQRFTNLRTKDSFGDARVTVEVRTRPESNSGIYLRGLYEIQIAETFGKPVDSHHMGALYSRIAPSRAVEKPVDEWQTLEIILVDQHLTVVLNDVTIIENQPVSGVTGGALASEDTGRGPLMLQGDHTDIDFRNLRVSSVLR